MPDQFEATIKFVVKLASIDVEDNIINVPNDPAVIERLFEWYTDRANQMITHEEGIDELENVELQLVFSECKLKATMKIKFSSDPIENGEENEIAAAKEVAENIASELSRDTDLADPIHHTYENEVGDEITDNYLVESGDLVVEEVQKLL